MRSSPTGKGARRFVYIPYAAVLLFGLFFLGTAHPEPGFHSLFFPTTAPVVRVPQAISVDSPPPARGTSLTFNQRLRLQQNVGPVGHYLHELHDFPGSQASPFLTLEWPVRRADGLMDRGTSNDDFYVITQYVDHNTAFPGQIHDYTCGSRTYDLESGYNHSGTDIMPYPLPWHQMDNGEIEVVAAADGVILHREDGYADRQCGYEYAEANFMALLHVDGSQTWYVHLKKGSLTTKSIGEYVAAGEYLGAIGSSGISTRPHLHFEVVDAEGNVVDPFYEPSRAFCSATGERSWWAESPSYVDSTISKIMTGTDVPQISLCDPARTYEARRFVPGENVVLTLFYRDLYATQQSHLTVYQPDGSIYVQWLHNSPEAYVSTPVWSWPLVLERWVPSGTWRFEVEFNGKKYEQAFEVGSKF